MPESLKIGMVGAGYVANNRHIPLWKHIRGATVVSVADLNESNLTSARNTHGISNTYADVEEMVKSVDLDIIDICTPPETHVPLGLLGMDHGCHVLTEKPLALSASDAQKLVEKTDETDMKLCTIHQMLYSPPTRRLREAVRNGEVGDIQGVRIFSSTPSDTFLQNEGSWIHDTDGGLLEETGPHLIYLSQPFLGDIINVEVFGRKKSEVPWAEWDDFILSLHGGQATASIRAIHHSDYRAFELEVWGTSGRIKTDLQTMHYHRFNRRNLEKIELARSALLETVSHGSSLVKTGLKTVTGQIQLGHEAIFTKFLDAVRHDTDPPVSADEALETVEILERATKKLKG